MMRQLYAHLQAQRDEMLATLRTLVEHETPTDNKAAIDRAQEFLFGELDALGAQVSVIPQTAAGDHLRATIASPFQGEGRGEGGRSKQLTILTHVDTVYAFGTLATMPFHMEPSRSGKHQLAHGPGIFDMKGGITIGLYALKALHELGLRPKRKIVFLVTSDEETGSRTSRELIENEARQSDTVLVLEPGVGPQGALKTWRKGIGGFHVTVTGRASHAGADPDRGRSAIIEMAHQILRLHALNDAAKGTTLNVGVMQGGTRNNVVAAEATAAVDVRVMTAAEWTRLEEAVRSLQPATPDTTLTITGGLNRPPMERTPQIMARYEAAKRLAAEIDYNLDETGTGGGSDGNFTAALGVPTLDGLGAVGNGAHSPNEFVLVSALPKRAALVAGLLMEL